MNVTLCYMYLQVIRINIIIIMQLCHRRSHAKVVTFGGRGGIHRPRAAATPDRHRVREAGTGS